MLEDPLTLAFIAIVFAVMVVPMLWLTVVGLREERHSDEVEPELAADPATEGITATETDAEGAEAVAAGDHGEVPPDEEAEHRGNGAEEPGAEEPGDDEETDEEPADAPDSAIADDGDAEDVEASTD